MEEIAERYSDGEISRLDGVSVDYPDWHFNVRPSNTEPLLRLNLESLVSREDMEAEARRGPRADPGVTADAGAGARAGGAGRHPPPAIPTPFAVGRVNCYLIEDEPLTLVDTGPNSGKALDELQRQLGERGHSIDDLELVDRHPPAHRPPRPGRDRRRALRRRGGGDRRRRRAARRTSTRTPRREDRSRSS